MVQTLVLLLLAAVLEVGGDALVRHGLHRHGSWSMVLGAAVLVGYGFTVNMTALDFSRLMGLYIVIFFLVSQTISVVFFREPLRASVMWGGSLVLAGGLVMWAGARR